MLCISIRYKIFNENNILFYSNIYNNLLKGYIMKKIMLILTFVIFCTAMFSSQVDFTQYQQINNYQLENMDYQNVINKMILLK